MHASVATVFIYRNNTSQPVVVYVEPWGNDYTVCQGQTLRVLVQGIDDEVPHFEMHHDVDGIQLWCELTHSFVAFIDDKEVECGHGRDINRR